MLTLVLARDLVDEIATHASSSYPEEACGLLFASASHPDVVSASVPMPNGGAGDRGRGYRMRPEAVHDALAAHGRGMAIRGFYHSHPDGDNRPSRQDTLSAFPDFAYVIVPVGPTGAGEPAAWSAPTTGAALMAEAMAHPSRAHASTEVLYPGVGHRAGPDDEGTTSRPAL